MISNLPHLHSHHKCASRCFIPLTVCAETRSIQSSRKLLETCATAQWGQCGGLSCPQGQTGCADQAWGCCPSGYGCSRSSSYYWQCLPNAPSAQVPSPSPSPAATPAATPSPTQSPAPATTTAPSSPPPPVPVTTTAPVATNAPSTRKLCTTCSSYKALFTPCCTWQACIAAEFKVPALVSSTAGYTAYSSSYCKEHFPASC